MATEQSRNFVDYTLYTIDRMWDVIRTLKRAQKRGTGLTEKEKVRLSKIIFETQKLVMNVFRDQPRYANTLNRKMEEIVPLLDQGDLDAMVEGDAKLESLISNMISWMIDHIVEIEAGVAQG